MAPFDRELLSVIEAHILAQITIQIEREIGCEIVKEKSWEKIGSLETKKDQNEAILQRSNFFL